MCIDYVDLPSPNKGRYLALYIRGDTALHLERVETARGSDMQFDRGCFYFSTVMILITSLREKKKEIKCIMKLTT